jgi:proline iminopeptidase
LDKKMKRFLSEKQDLLKLNDIEIFYKCLGEGEPVVILHGGPGFDHNNMRQFEELAKNFNVILYDQRASGNSSGNVDEESITVDNFVKDLEGLRKNLKLGKINLIGHSWGGFLGMSYGIKYPDKLRSLVLINPTAASSRYFGQYFENIQKRTTQDDIDAILKIEQSEELKSGEVSAEIERLRISLIPFFFDPSSIKYLNLEFGKNTLLNQGKIGTLLLKDLGEYDLHSRLNEIKCPVMVIHSDKDPLPLEGSYEIYKHLPDSRFIVLKNCGHFSYVEAKEELFSLIERFLIDQKSVTSNFQKELEE